MEYTYHGKKPETGKSAFVAPSADIVGDVVLGEDSSVWYNTTIRGDLAAIRIGRGTNIQDNSVMHVDEDTPATVGDYVVVGHNAILHGCTIGNNSLIGMGSIILNRAVIGSECVVGAGALVTENKRFPDRSLIVGSPAKAIRTLEDKDVARIKDAAERYIKKAKEHRKMVEDGGE